MTNAPVPSPRTFNVAEYETAAYLNSVRDALNFLLNPPAATLVQVTTTTSLTTGTWTSVGMDSSTFDNYGGHSNTTNNSRYTCQAAGKYQVSGTPAISTNGTNSRAAKILKNGAVVQGPYSMVGASPNRPTSVTTGGFIIPLVVGDYVELAAFQDSGSTLTTSIATDQSSFFTVIRLSS